MKPKYIFVFKSCICPRIFRFYGGRGDWVHMGQVIFYTEILTIFLVNF